MAVEFDAVSVGAIFSRYQRERVLNVCKRLGLEVLAYLWERDQAELLKEMVDCGVKAIVIKVAALGLKPRHLGWTIGQLLPHLLDMSKQYGMNVCGEGGEYETFTLDCPLFRKEIVLEEATTENHSSDDVAYLNLVQLSLRDKNLDSSLSMKDLLQGLPMKME